MLRDDARTLGGKVIDTARGYGSSEEVIGKLLAELGNRDKFFLATKTPLAGDVSGGTAVLDESFRRLQVSKIDLLQIHNFLRPRRADAAFRRLQEGRQDPLHRRARTSVDAQYAADASTRWRSTSWTSSRWTTRSAIAARPRRMLPMAQDKGIAVLINVPFGGRGRSFFPRVAGKPLPDFAKEFGATTWAQFFLKYILAQSGGDGGDSRARRRWTYLRDNQQAGRGALPDAAMRKRMEEFWDAMPA